MTAITYNDTKFRELLLYVAERSEDDPSFGKTKLNKIFYYADFYAYGIFGSPITGATYQKRDYGPVPKQIASVRSKMQASGEMHFEHVSRFGRRQDRMVADRNPDLSVFSPDEKELIDDIIDALRDQNGKEVSDLSHKQMGWILADDFEEIPYHTVFLDGGPITSADRARTREVFAEIQASAA